MRRRWVTKAARGGVVAGVALLLASCISFGPDQTNPTTVGRDDAITSLVWADLNADGVPNLIKGGNVGWANWTDTCGPTCITDLPATLGVPGQGRVSSMVTGDWNADGIDDLATVVTNGTTSWLGTGIGKQRPVAEANSGLTSYRTYSTTSGIGRVDQLAAGDLDGDGDDDIAYTGADGYGWMEGRGAADFRFETPEILVATPIGPTSRFGDTVAADVDGDDVPEVVSAVHGVDGTGALTGSAVIAHDATGGVVAQWTAPAGRIPVDLAAGDLDGDGRADLAVSLGNAVATPREILVLRSSGTALAPFGPASSILPGAVVLDVAIRDADGDGNADLFATTKPETGGMLHWWAGEDDGIGTTAAPAAGSRVLDRRVDVIAFAPGDQPVLALGETTRTHSVTMVENRSTP